MALYRQIFIDFWRDPKVTEEMMGEQKQTPLQQREAELSALEAEARGYDEAEALKGKLEHGKQVI